MDVSVGRVLNPSIWMGAVIPFDFIKPRNLDGALRVQYRTYRPQRVDAMVLEYEHGAGDDPHAQMHACNSNRLPPQSIMCFDCFSSMHSSLW